MGDRSYAQIVVHAAPGELHAQIAELIEDSGVSGGLGEAKIDAGLALNTQYAAEEVSLGRINDLARALVELSPDIAFRASQDAKYEYDGDLHMQAPGLGHYSAEMTSSGAPIVTADQIRTVLAEAASLEAAREGVARLYGEPWDVALAAIEANPRGR